MVDRKLWDNHHLFSFFRVFIMPNQDNPFSSPAVPPLENVLGEVSASAFTELVQSILLTLFSVMIIFFTYKRVFKSDDYKAKFNLCLTIIIIVTTMIITTIKTNINISIGLVGILSVIRFRVKINDFRDVGFILWGIGSGVAIATNHYLICFTYSVVISLVFVLMNDKLIKKGSVSTLIIRSKKLDNKKLEALLEQSCSYAKNIAINHKENYTEYVYDIDCKKREKLKEKILNKFNIGFIKFV